MRIFDNIEDALKCQYDGAVIAVPSHLHAEIACRVIENKLPVMLEKPIDVNMEEAERICDSVDKNKSVCLIAYCLRFDLGLCKIKDILDSGILGKVYSVDSFAGDYLPESRPGSDYRKLYSAFRDKGGGVCIDYSHELDYFRWLFGEVHDVLAMVGKVSDLKIEVEDVSECLVKCENGAIGRIHVDYFSRVPRRRLLINCRNGVIDYDLLKRDLNVFNASENKTDHFSYDGKRNLIYLKQIRHFFDCIKGQSKPLITAKDATKTLKLALMIRSNYSHQ